MDLGNSGRLGMNTKHDGADAISQVCSVDMSAEAIRCRYELGLSTFSRAMEARELAQTC